MKAKLLIPILLLSSNAFADGTGKIYPDEHRHGEVIRETPHHGALYPNPTYNSWDDEERPNYWNGYGVDPTGPNFYHYFDEQPCQYDFMWDLPQCHHDHDDKKDLPPIEDEEDSPKPIPEPSSLLLLLVGAGFVAMRKLKWHR